MTGTCAASGGVELTLSATASNRPTLVLLDDGGTSHREHRQEQRGKDPTIDFLRRRRVNRQEKPNPGPNCRWTSHRKKITIWKRGGRVTNSI